ncbi:MAG TPA: ribonuclease HII [Acidimicrobiales bacterium]|nr:ribonuclease HII [Acidimicrobiales bacterium]
MSVTSLDLLEFERTLLARGEIVVGIDEVGRGALAGPMTVGAVVICSEEAPPKGLNDSKLLTAARRESLVEPLCQWAAAWSLGSVSASEIDAWGLRLALAVAATRALNALTLVPTYALIDGSFNLLRSPLDVGFGVVGPPELSYASLPATTIVKGDQRSATIAAAAVLAKVARDAVMVALHEECGQYQWASNKGYGAAEHLEAIRRHGPHAYHRTSWNLPVKTSP